MRRLRVAEGDRALRIRCRLAVEGQPVPALDGRIAVRQACQRLLRGPSCPVLPGRQVVTSISRADTSSGSP
jgi:hypothetical protein